jgi:hypothetical protein
MLPMPGMMIEADQNAQKSQNINSCHIGLSCPVVVFRISPLGGHYFLHKQEDSVTSNHLISGLQIIYFAEIIYDRKDQAKLWYVICTFQICCFPSSQDGLMDCCAEA